MNYSYTKSGKLVSVSIHELFDDTDAEHILIADSENHLKNMIKDTIKKGLEKNNQMTWNKGLDTEITIFKEKEYSDYPEEFAKTISYFTKTVSKIRIVETNKIVKRNPKYVDNPECEFCYEKSIQLFEDHLLDENKTKKMVCGKCRKTLKQMREILEKNKKEVTN